MVGELMRTRRQTIFWRDDEEINVPRNQVVILVDEKMHEVVPGINAVNVFHVNFGRFLCLLDDLKFVKN